MKVKVKSINKPVNESVILTERNSPRVDSFKVDPEALALDISVLSDDDSFDFYYDSGDCYAAKFELVIDNFSDSKNYFGYQSESGEFVLKDDEGHEIWGRKPSDFISGLKEDAKLMLANVED